MKKLLLVASLIVGCDNLTDSDPLRSNEQTVEEDWSYSGIWNCQADIGASEGYLHAYCIYDTALYIGKWDSKDDCLNAGGHSNTITQTMCIEPDLLCGIPQTHQSICAPDTSESNPDPTDGVGCWL